MVDLWALAVANGLFVGRRRHARVQLDIEFEYGGVEALCGAEGGNDDRGVERFIGQEKLQRDFLLGLRIYADRQ